MHDIKTKQKIVGTYIEKIMPLTERPPIGWIKYPSLKTTIGSTYSSGIYLWDHHHMAMRFAYSGKQEYLKYYVSNFLTYQHTNGYVSSIIDANHGVLNDWHAQPYLAQATLIYVANSHDQHWLAQIFEKLKKYIEYYELNLAAPFGLYRWRQCHHSGIDNDIATNFTLPQTVITCDLSALLVLELASMERLAALMGEKEDEKVFNEKTIKLKSAINTVLWNAKMGSFSAFDLRENASLFSLGKGDGKIGRFAFQSCSNLFPLYAGVAEKDKAKEMIETYLLNTDHFFSDFGIRSLSKSSEYYNNAIWGNPPRFGDYRRMTNSNWQGPVWFPLCYFSFHALRRYGYMDKAAELMEKTISLLAGSLEKIGDFTENYHAENGAPLYARKFASWNILADMMKTELESGKWIMDPIFEEKRKIF